MKSKKLKIFLLALCLILSLWLLQRLLVPKYIEQNEEGVLAGEYYANAGSNDVLFVGDCEVYSNFSPITLWQEDGITSITRGTPSQTIWQRYHIIRHVALRNAESRGLQRVLHAVRQTAERGLQPTFA